MLTGILPKKSKMQLENRISGWKKHLGHLAILQWFPFILLYATQYLCHSDIKMCNKALCAEDHSTSHSSDTIVSVLVGFFITDHHNDKSNLRYYHLSPGVRTIIFILLVTWVESVLIQLYLIVSTHLIRIVTTPKFISGIENYMKH